MLGNVTRLVLDRPRTLVRLLFLLTGGAALVLGFWGFVLDEKSWHRALLLDVQLFVVNVDPDRLATWQTQVAGLLAPTATVASLVLAFHASLVRRWRYLVLLFRPAEEAFLGGGDMAGAILEQRDADGGRGGRVIGLDVAAEQRLERALRSRTWRGHVHLGDALADSCLRNLNLVGASKLWVLAGDDLRNLEIVRRLLKLRTARPAAPPQDIIVHLRDIDLARGAARPARGEKDGGEKNGAEKDGAHVEYFNLPRLAARRLLMEHPPPYPGVTAERPLHICMVGDSELNAALLVHAATHCVYAVDSQLAVRLTLIARDAGRTLEGIHRRHPALAPSASADPALDALLPLARVATLDADPAHVSVSQWVDVQREHAFDMIYVAAEHDLSTFAAARRVLALRDAREARARSVGTAAAASAAEVVVCVNDHRAYAAGDETNWPDAVTRFDIFARCFACGESYPGSQSDAMAEILHEFYCRSQGATQSPWADLAESLRRSARLGADHIHVKMKVLGTPYPPEPESMTVFEKTMADNLDFLMRLEHRRFIAERLLDGWLALPPEAAYRTELPPSRLLYGEQKRQLSLSAALLPYDPLVDGEREKVRLLVDAIRTCALARPKRRPEAPVAPVRPTIVAGDAAAAKCGS